MRIIYGLLLILGLPWVASARHIKGGEINYQYIGPGSTANSERYQVTLRLFLECGASGNQLDAEANIGVFRNSDEIAVSGSPFSFPLTGDEFINLTAPNPCINNPSPVCYRLRTYSREIELTKTELGYTFVFQRCCRINGLVNLSPNTNVGSSYTCKMGGTDVLGIGSNSSPAFAIKDTVLICQYRPFTLDFSATDTNGDSLSYEFCDAYTALQNGQGGAITPVPPSQIGFVNYSGGFDGTTPMGAGVRIDPKTGLISGIAPGGGDYVISVCVKEWRNGKVLSEHRKDFNLKVDQFCDLAAASLAPNITNCDNYLQFFQNEAPPSTLTHTYFWDFGVPGLNSDTSTQSAPNYTYADTGTYTIKLIINRGEQCSDSATTQVRIYPGFFPKMNVQGACIQTPYTYSDLSTARYGVINSWNWNFGDETSADDVSTKKNDSWLYSTVGFKNVILTVSSSKGCTATIDTTIEVKLKPIVNLGFRDTLICSIDTLQLVINGPGNYQWTPAYNIINPGIANPLVYPKSTTTYYVAMNDRGCINNDSVKIRVVDEVTLSAGPDTTICLTDTIRLNPTTDGLKFSWTPTATLLNPTSKSPLAFPSSTTTYSLLASIGKCSKQDEVTIKTVPYPFSNAGADTVICYDDTAQLHANIKGIRFTWTPVSSLSGANTLKPIAYPLTTTVYNLLVYDTLGCPKPGVDQVIVTVRPKILAFAGNDTSVVIGQPLQLNASGADLYSWSPALYLSNSSIPNPIALLSDNQTYILKAFTEEGCFALDTIRIKLFKTGPDIFVPNAFVPSGKNRVLRPIPVGIAQFEFFRVYNRMGQLVFQSSNPSYGWDGTIGGYLQGSGTYVWVAGGIDYTGKKILRKGTAILVR